MDSWTDCSNFNHRQSSLPQTFWVSLWPLRGYAEGIWINICRWAFLFPEESHSCVTGKFSLSNTLPHLSLGPIQTILSLPLPFNLFFYCCQAFLTLQVPLQNSAASFSPSHQEKENSKKKPRNLMWRMWANFEKNLTWNDLTHMTGRRHLICGEQLWK